MIQCVCVICSQMLIWRYLSQFGVLCYSFSVTGLESGRDIMSSNVWMVTFGFQGCRWLPRCQGDKFSLLLVQGGILSLMVGFYWEWEGSRGVVCYFLWCFFYIAGPLILPSCFSFPPPHSFSRFALLFLITLFFSERFWTHC